MKRGRCDPIISRMRKLRFKGIQQLVRGHTARTRRHQRLIQVGLLGLPCLRPSLFCLASYTEPCRTPTELVAKGNILFVYFIFWFQRKVLLHRCEWLSWLCHLACNAGSVVLRAQILPLRLRCSLKAPNSFSALCFREAAGQKAEDRRRGELLCVLPFMPSPFKGPTLHRENCAPRQGC